MTLQVGLSDSTQSDTWGHIFIQPVKCLQLVGGSVISRPQLWPNPILVGLPAPHSSGNHGRHADTGRRLLAPV